MLTYNFKLGYGEMTRRQTIRSRSTLDRRNGFSVQYIAIENGLTINLAISNSG
jgi:hypothetical protein